MNVNLEVELSDLLYKVKELRVAAKYISNEPIRGDILRIADQLEQSEKRIRELTISKNPYRYLDESEFQNQEIIRNVEWIVADQKKQTVFESLHPLSKKWVKRIILGRFEKEQLETQFFIQLRMKAKE
jgi:hypothetical protein